MPIVISDCSPIYVNNRSNISRIEDYIDVNHYWVNHLKRFNDEYQNDIHINNIEQLWRSLRSSIGLLKRAISSNEIEGFINQFEFYEMTKFLNEN